MAIKPSDSMAYIKKGYARSEQWRERQRLARLKYVGENHPMFGRKHTEESKEKMRESAIGKHDGERNPCFGKFGSEHPAFGRVVTDREREIVRAANTGERSYAWKGDFVSYKALHQWVNKHKPKSCCTKCGKVGRVEAHCVSGNYLRDLNDYIWLCSKCHKAVEKELRLNAGSEI